MSMKNRRAHTSRAERAVVAVVVVLAGCSNSDPVGTAPTVLADLGLAAFDMLVAQEETIDVSVSASQAAVVDSIAWQSTAPAVLEIVGAPAPASKEDEITVRALSAGSAYIRVRVAASNGAGSVVGVDSVEVTVTFAGTIEGIVRDSASGPGLPDVLVRAIGATAGSSSPVTTDATGAYSIDVTEPDTYTLCAIGIIPVASVPQRFVNTNCLNEDVVITNTSVDGSLDLTIETGYYLGFTNGPFDSNRTPGEAFSISADYRAWIREAVPATTAWIAVGIEEDAQDTGLGQNAGHYSNPQPAATGSVVADLTAPTTAGTYRIFARLLPVATEQDALDLYESGFANSLETNYAQIGTVTVN